MTTFTEHELLENHDYEAPLIVGGVRCHGGFDASGTYVSPRTRNRVPAITSWQDQHRSQFGTDLLAMPLETWPPHYPNVAQAKFLIGNGVSAPIVSTLTRIGTVEGFGSMIRYSAIPALERCFDEEIEGTATAHLGRGLYEAHARDEAGHGDEGGHKQMWFAARDIAFEHPVTEDETDLMLQRMGIPTPGAALQGPVRLLPDDVDADLEILIERMVRLLLIEISAFHTFAWAEEVLADREIVAGDGDAARIVSYIRADETPHVEYLKTTLSEMRDRTFVGSGGRKYAGTDLIGRLWDRALGQSLGERNADAKRIARDEVLLALQARRDGADLLEGFDALAS
ncbi:MAG: hypothetical protein ACYDH6_16280 [Acidimicrobiales bacterium]